MEGTRVPDEPWRDIHEMATTIPDEFNITPPTFQYNEIYNTYQYTQDWSIAMCTRLKIMLVFRTWYKIASEFLYSSLLVRNNTDPRSFMSLIL